MVGTFQETYKNAYSHGLEEIYSIETIDLKTVRPLQTSAIKKLEVKKAQEDFDFTPDFDFGLPYRNWITPFFLREPIEVLNLSMRAEEAIAGLGIKTLKDLNCDLFAKGIGQGHIDEAMIALEVYTNGRSQERSYQFEMGSWFKSLGVDRGAFSVLLQNYGLEELLGLTPAEQIEVKHLTAKKKEEWVEKGRFSFLEVKPLIINDIQIILSAFVTPWAMKRQGIILQWELIERMEQICDVPASFRDVIKLLSHELFDGEFPFLEGLVKVGESVYSCKQDNYTSNQNVYACNEDVANRYYKVEACAFSYFYQPSVSYLLSDLVLLVGRELGKNWESISGEFIDKVIRYSPRFRTRKNDEGLLSVKRK